MARILVVDDDHSNAEVVQILLEEAGHEVVNIQLAARVWEVLTCFTPDLIVMDILLGQDDGRLICNLLKDDPKTLHIPVMLVTAMLESRVSAFPCSAEMIIFKPFDCGEMLGKVEVLIGSPDLRSTFDS